MAEDKSLSDEATQSESSTATKSPSTDVPQTTASVPASERFRGLIPVAIFSLSALIFFFTSSFWNVWSNRVAVNTDDAYVRSDVAPLSTKANGIVLRTMVRDYDRVVAGQPLVELRAEDFQDKVIQAQQGLTQNQIKLDDMKQRKEKQEADVADARATLEASRATAAQFKDTLAIAQAGIEEATAGVKVAEATIRQSESSYKAATADLVKTKAELDRQIALLAVESTTKQKVEQVTDENARALAAQESQALARSKAEAELVARKAQLLKARQSLASTFLERDKAVIAIKSRAAEVLSKEKQRELLDGEERQLRSELAGRKSAFATSKIDRDYAVIKAPVEGIVGELKVKAGQYVSAGTQVITLISARPWLIANYRETQIAGLKPGDRAHITFDALANVALEGHVENIAPASGAQFSLLPPDNASGNFTKITQRIPVKITFDESDENNRQIGRLRPGMSATVTISPSQAH